MQRQYQHSMRPFHLPDNFFLLLLPLLALFLILIVAGFLRLNQAIQESQAELPTRAEVAHLPTAPAYMGNPTIAVSPLTGAPGTHVTVTGQGWQPDETLIVCLDDLGDGTGPLIYATARTDETGDFSAAFTFPSTVSWRSLPIIPVIVESQSYQTRASVSFTLLTPTAWPTTGVAETVAPTSAASAAASATPIPTARPPVPTSTPWQPTATVAPPTPTSPPPTATPLPTATFTPIPAVWRGEYYPNVTLGGAPALVRDDPTLNFYWGSGAPATGLPADGFSVRWTRTFYLTVGSYRFNVHSDDGVRLWVDGLLLINQWHDADGTTYQSDLYLASGLHTVRLEYYENMGMAQLQFWWEQPNVFPEWRGDYWANRTLSGEPAMVRNDRELNFNWGAGAPATGFPVDGFSARWTRTLSFAEGAYRFRLLVDDGARVYVDGLLLIDEWRDGNARERRADRWLNAGPHTLQVEYYENTGNAILALSWEKEPPSYPDWRGEYWANQTLTGSPVLVRNDGAVDFNWGFNSPDPLLPADNFSVRWTRLVNFGNSGVYRFYARSDDGIRIYVDGNRILDQWHDGGASTTYTADLTLGGNHTVVIEYFDHLHSALVKVWFERFEPTATATLPPPTNTPMAISTPIPTNTPAGPLTLMPMPLIHSIKED